MKAPAPGIYADVPFAEYCEWEAVNNSSLGPALKSILHYVSYTHTIREPSDALRFGCMAHNGVLEPTSMLEHYVSLPVDFEADIVNADGSTPKNVKATKQYKDKLAEFCRVNKGKQIIDRAEFERLISLVSSVREHPRAAAYLTRQGLVECSMVWQDAETGLLCKGRMDHYSEKYMRITDLKTTRDAGDFEKSIANFAYDRQAAFYMDGLRTLGHPVEEFCLVCVESDVPFAVRAAPVDQDTIDDGRRAYKEALRNIAAYRRTFEITGYPDPDYWRKPSWAFPKNDDFQLTFNGEALKL